jgi:hypothetical protein
MWRAFMDIALAKLEKESFGEPPAPDPELKPVLRGEIVDAAMLLQNIQSGSSTLDLMGVSAGIHEILHYVDKRNPRGPYPTNPANDPQYNNWEWAVQKWKEQTYLPLIPQIEVDNNDDDDEDDEDEDEDDNNRSNRRSLRDNDDN